MTLAEPAEGNNKLLFNKATDSWGISIQHRSHRIDTQSAQHVTSRGIAPAGSGDRTCMENIVIILPPAHLTGSPIAPLWKYPILHFCF